MYYIVRTKSKGIYGKSTSLHNARAMKKEAEETKDSKYAILKRID